jgi:hypothetical protein
MSTQQKTGRRPVLAAMLAVAVTASMIGLAPSAAAKGIVLPRDGCMGPQVAARSCSKVPQPIPAHTLSPHGSKHRKIEIAAAREGRPVADSQPQGDD